MRRNPALPTIILCVAPLGLAAQTPERVLHDRGQAGAVAPAQDIRPAYKSSFDARPKRFR